MTNGVAGATPGERLAGATNATRALAGGAPASNPYSGMSVAELWAHKPTWGKGRHDWATPDENRWFAALEAASPNPYAGKSVRQLRQMKPKMRRSDHCMPEDEEDYNARRWWHALHAADPSGEWSELIEFYGVVVNQSNRPLPGVTVEAQWVASDGSTPKRPLVTDKDGRFSVSNVVGKCLEVMVWGERGKFWAFHSAHQSFEYNNIFESSYYTPDPAKPVVFRLWQYSNPEPMYKANVMSKRFPADGKPIWIDAKTGKYVSSGQIGFSVSRVSATNWLAGYTITIHAADGGGVMLADKDDELMFEAPEKGYQPVVNIEQAAGDVYAGGKEFGVYLQTPEKKYAALKTDRFIQYNDGTARMNGLIYYNPSGSRNLQFIDDLMLRDDRRKVR